MALSHGIKIPDRDFEQRMYFSIELKDGVLPEQILARFPDWKYEHQARGLPYHHVVSVDKSKASGFGSINSDSGNLWKRSEAVEELMSLGLHLLHLLPPKTLSKRAPVVDLSNDKLALPLAEATKRLGIDDPLFSKQWHLINVNYPGNDVNVSGVWYDGITGEGVTVLIVDDGLDYESQDLQRAFSKEGSWDFNTNSNLPKPLLNDDYHGTRCASEIAAEKGNDYCGIGVAYNSKVSGIRILSGPITSEDEAASLIYNMDVNDIYSCSWGPPDDGKSMQLPDLIVKAAMVQGVLDGRQGKGALYVFASGNGGFHGDNCNFDGYTNSIYSITVGAIDHKGLHPPYSESCSAVMVTTYSSGSGEHINTGDFHDKCTDNHGGTSAAAPLAAGIYSLVLEANPDLTWRDVQYLSALSSVEINEGDGGWQESALGKRYSHKYGYGKIDAYKIVELAKRWENVNPQEWYYLPVERVEKKAKGGETVTSSVEITETDLQNGNFAQVEHITVTVNVDAQVRGDVKFTLTSPNGMVSELAPFRQLDRDRDGFRNWTFMSVAHWGETGVGKWELKITGRGENEFNVHDWQLKLFGASADASKARRFPIPGHENDAAITTKSLGVDTPLTTVTPATSAVETTTTPQTTTTTTPQTTTSSATTSAISTLTPVQNENENYENEEGVQRSSNTHYFEYFLFLLTIGFIIVVAIMKTISNKNKRRRRRDEYEFDIINLEDDTDDDTTTADEASFYDRDNRALNNPFDDDFQLSDEESHLDEPVTRSTAAPENKDDTKKEVHDQEQEVPKETQKELQTQDSQLDLKDHQEDDRLLDHSDETPGSTK